MKRLIAAALWFYASWYLGSMIAGLVGVPDLIGPVLGPAAAILVGVDPRGAIWAREGSTIAVTPATAQASAASQTTA